MEAFAFRTVFVRLSLETGELEGPVVRTIAVREDQTLEQLHEALRLTFGWGDPHLYSFWLSGKRSIERLEIERATGKRPPPDWAPASS